MPNPYDNTSTMEIPGRGLPTQNDAVLVLLFAPNWRELPHVVPIPAHGLVIGRDAPVGGLSIAQNAVSRIHARLARSRDSWVVADLQSRNGTLVNGRFVDEQAITDGDVLRVGDALFKFVMQDGARYVPYRLDGVGSPPVRIAGMLGGALLGRSADELARIAPTDLPVLLLGESGTGKEVASRGLHDASERKGRFCAVNCAAIPSTLLESELFGVRRGAFTGADRDRVGLVRSAHEGTLLLDEIGDMPREAQAKLLRMIETQEIVPLGASVGEKVDVRLVCATHQNLAQRVQQGAFRGDLYARINGYALTLPPLRQRKEDLFLLIRHFLLEGERPELVPSLAFMVAAIQYDWPFNVRELRTAIRRAIALADAGELDVPHLPQAVQDAMQSYGKREREQDAAPRGAGSDAPSPPHAVASPPGRATAPSEMELRELLTRHEGNIAAIARELRKDRVQIHRWLQRYSLDPEAYRKRS